MRGAPCTVLRHVAVGVFADAAQATPDLELRQADYDGSGDDGAGLRLRLAIEMFGFGERMQRQRLRRSSPESTPDEIDDAMRAWLRHRPGAVHGDHPGTPSNRFA